MRALRWLIPALVLVALSASAPSANAIVGGSLVTSNTYPYEYPYQARVLMNAPSGNYSCGASIHDATHVVTAAHCVYIDDTLLAPGNVAVGYGSTSQSTLIGATVAEVRMPAAYLSDESYDVAVLELAAPLPIGTASVDSIDVAGSAALTTGVAAEDDAFATGWGHTTEGGSGSNGLREVALPLRDDSVCSIVPQYAGYVPERTVCAGGKGAAASGNPDTCQGDSGGPLALDSGSGFTLVGITSYGYGCGRTLMPAAYTEAPAPGISQVIDGTAPASGLLKGSEWAPPTSGGAPAVTTPVAQAPSPPAPVVAARDTVRPTARVSKLSCSKKRKCSFRIAAADKGGTVRKLSATVTRKVKTCKRWGDFRVCTTTTRKKTLKPTRIRGGFSFSATLAKATYRLSSVATDAAGNRSKTVSRTFRVR